MASQPPPTSTLTSAVSISSGSSLVHSLFISPLYQNLCRSSSSSGKIISHSLPSLPKLSSYRGFPRSPIPPPNFLNCCFAVSGLFLSSSHRFGVFLPCPLHPPPKPCFLPLSLPAVLCVLSPIPLTSAGPICPLSRLPARPLSPGRGCSQPCPAYATRNPSLLPYRRGQGTCASRCASEATPPRPALLTAGPGGGAAP